MKSRKERSRGKRKAGVLFAVGLFYMAMLVLTMLGHKVYRASQIPVTVVSPSVQYDLEGGYVVSRITLPAKMADGPLYTIERTEVNGSLRLVAKEISGVVFGERNGEESIIVKKGISQTDILILDGSDSLYDGKEVRVLNEEDLPAWWK